MFGTPAGTHCILELFECPFDLLNDELFVRDALVRASRRSLSTLLNITSHKFHPQGVTVLGLLAESHISIHTWPEHGYAAIDVFTCGQNADPAKACDFLIKHFAARSHQLKILSRGAAHVSDTQAIDAAPWEAHLCRAPS